MGGLGGETEWLFQDRTHTVGWPEGASEEAPQRALKKASVSDTHTLPQAEPEEQGASGGLWACPLRPDARRAVAQGAPVLAHCRSPGGQDRGQSRYSSALD